MGEAEGKCSVSRYDMVNNTYVYVYSILAIYDVCSERIICSDIFEQILIFVGKFLEN